MDLWTRLVTIIKAKLSNSENPRKALRQNIEQMQDAMQELGFLEKKLKGLKIKLRNMVEDLEKASEEFHEQAREAYGMDDKETAKLLLTEKNRTQAWIKGSESSIKRISQRLEPLNKSLKRLKMWIKIYKTMEQVISTIYDASIAELRNTELRAGISTEVPMDLHTALKRSNEEIIRIREKMAATEELLTEGILPSDFLPLTNTEDERLLDISDEMEKLKQEKLTQKSKS